jgi:hypothetical protein
MSNLVLFTVGLIIAVPAGIVVVGLVLTATEDGRDQRKQAG